ncbi:Hsp30p [Sugiyamaella lignohabitans]|uniref:Hsp30p n=1 Tax=Sugiyamaella lignohabitans TaxID=796027 RepID=A0A167E6W7_9ASCO|nr:Hsp30p [Sugiyamaella lignohabitans]ANB13718.1 Hsp30p [Sugiyamaella lignohabitans]
MSILVPRGNEALKLNPPFGLDIHITTHGSDWYWTVFSLFALASLGGLVFSRIGPQTGSKFFYYNYMFSTFVLSIAYYTMASDLGWTGIQAEFNHATVDDGGLVPGIRQIFYTRYVGWFLAFPPLVANFAVLSALPISTSFFTVLTVEVFVVSLLIGSLIHSTYKWGYFVFAVVSILLTAYNLFFSFRRAATSNVSHITGAVKTVTFGVSAVAGLMFLYPLSWGLSEGGNVIQPDSEAVFYGVIDICMFIAVPTFFIFTTSTIEAESLGLRNFNTPLFHSDNLAAEKEARYSGDTAVSNFAPTQPAAGTEPVSVPEPVATNPAAANAV